MPQRLQLFGAPGLDRDGALHALPFERRSQLIALLALRRRWLPRAEVAAMLWPGQQPRQAFGNLRSTLFRLPKLASGVVVESEAEALRCLVETDVLDFDAALAAQRPADALALYRGPLLHGFDDDANEIWTGWLRFERQRLQAAWREAALAQLATDDGSPAGIALAARLLEADPLDETAMQAQVRLLAAAGQLAQARRAWQDFAERLRDQLGILPGPALQALHDSLTGAPAAARPAVAPVARLAIEDPSFIGRMAERRQLIQLLQDPSNRCLTLTGQGGAGKTRLARHVLRELASSFTDGALFVPLEDLVSSADAVVRIAREASITLRGRAAPLDQLALALGSKRLLLLLDNAEQLADGPATFAALLAACPRLQLLVTSRTRLGLAEEQLVPVEGLPCPEAEDSDRLEAFDAARLFLAAARRVQPALRGSLPAPEAAAIVEICRQVDGLPLALELAAAWTRMLPCTDIAAELGAGTALLRSQDATHPPRHASLDQVFEQSWSRLAPAEQSGLARLSVFHGGFGAEAARAVADAPLPLIGTLVDKSLLRHDGKRLSMHPLIQQLATQRLAPAEAAATRQAHADHFLRLLQSQRTGIERGEREALRLIDDELENCRLAWHWLVEAGQADKVAAAAPLLQGHHDHRGRFEAALNLLREAAAAPSLAGHAAVQGLLLAEAAQCAYRLDRYPEAIATATLALDRAGRDADRRTRLRVASVHASCALRGGRLPDARRHFRQALALARAERQPHAIATTLDHLALVEKRLGHYQESLALSLDALAQHRRNEDSASIALCLNNLGDLYLVRRQFDAAAPHLEEALAICERDGLATRIYVCANLAEVALARGKLADATRHTERTRALADETGNRAMWIWAQLYRARLATHRADFDSAREALAAGLSLARTLGLPGQQSRGLLFFAELLHAQQEPLLAVQLLAHAIAHAGTGAPDRDEMREQLARWQQADAVVLGRPLPLDEVLHRVVVESELAHGPLRVWLRERFTAR